MKIPFETFLNLHKFNPESTGCYEIHFSVDGYNKYQNSWMGNTPIKNELGEYPDAGKRSYWFGLTPDNTEAYDFSSFDKMVNAPVFEGKSLKEIWNEVDILSFDGCSPEEIIPIYLDRL